VPAAVAVGTASVAGSGGCWWWRACRSSTRCQSDIRGLVTAGRAVRRERGRGL